MFYLEQVYTPNHKRGLRQPGRDKKTNLSQDTLNNTQSYESPADKKTWNSSAVDIASFLSWLSNKSQFDSLTCLCIPKYNCNYEAAGHNTCDPIHAFQEHNM